VLTFSDPDFLGNGFVVYDYRIAESTDELLFYVNGKRADVTPTLLPNSFSRVQIYLTEITSPTPLTLTWVAMLHSADSESKASILMQNVRIGGVSTGTSTQYYCDPGSEASEDQSYCLSCAPGTASAVTGTPCNSCAEGTYASRPGQNRCTACYDGTTSEYKSGSTRCVTSCVFSGHNDTLYNMTAFQGTIIGPITSNSISGTFFFSLCDGLFEAGQCSSSSEEDTFMHSCFTEGNGPEQVDFGSELEYIPAEEGTPEEDLSFIINFRDGSVCPDDSEQRLETTIFFRCSPNAGAGVPQFLSYSSSTCTATFSWASQYACHTCKDDEYEEVVSACKNRKQKTELHKIGYCYGPDRILVEETGCTDIAVPIGIVAGVAGLIVIMIGVVIFVIYKNRKITYKYTKLLQDQAAELEAMADEVDDGKSMSKNLVPVSQDDEEKQDKDSDDELRDDDDEEEEEEDDGQGVGHIRK